MYDISASIVAFKNDRELLARAMDSFLSSGLNTRLYVIDNSPTDALRKTCIRKNVEYLFSNGNLGFGAGHNIAIRRMDGKAKYFLFLNPDVYFDAGTLEKLFGFMEMNRDVGLTMPKVLYPDGSLQYLCRLLPAPIDSLLRKVDIPISLVQRRKMQYELRFANHDKLMDIPSLSGCFMFVRSEALEKVGGFDERFFIYFEDVDLSRRINRAYRNVYFPEAVIYHGYQRGSEKDIKLLWQLIISGIKYYNKWGWFLDKERKSLNMKAISRLKESTPGIL